MSLVILEEKCYKMGQEATEPEDEKTLSKKFAKEIVKLKILDDDAFEIASKYYQKGLDERNRKVFA
jgi:hypothetical protein